MGRRIFSVEANGEETDDSRCRRTDGRRWRCPMPALPNTSYCEHHRHLFLRGASGSQKPVSDSEPPKPNRMLDLNLVADSDPEKISFTSDPPPRRRRKMRQRDNGDDLPLPEVGQSSDPSVALGLQLEMDSDREKLNRTAGSLATNMMSPMGEKGESRTEDTGTREEEIGVVGEKGTDSDPISKDLIRMAVKRQMKRREEREERKRSEKQPEVRRELPNGVMAISPSPVKNSSNVGRIIDKKIGLGFNEGCSLRRRFRSKNVEQEPVGSVKKFPRGLGRRKAVCHSCGEKGTTNGTRESCKRCKSMGAEDIGFEVSTHSQNNFSEIKYTDYFICQLLPVFKQLKWEQIFELEIEANNQGRRLAGVQLQVIECSHNVQFKCNYCRISIVSLHRSCSKCYYKLCLNCCREIRGESLPESVEIVTCQYPTKGKACEHIEPSNGMIKEHSSECHSPIVRERTNNNRDEIIPCPPKALGGCGDGMLNMKLLLPFGWTLKPDTAEDMEGYMNGG